MKKKRIGVFALQATTILLAMSCRQTVSPHWEGRSRMVSGVLEVTNPKKPIYPEDLISFAKELVIGEAKGKQDPVFSTILSFDVDAEGHIYALDAKRSDALAFDENGRYLWSIGTYGQGPGEMQRPQFIQICPDQQKLVIWDPVVLRFLYFSLEGDFVDEVSVSQVGFPLNPVKWDARGNLIAFVIPPPIEGGIRLEKFDSELRLLMSIGREDPDPYSLTKEHLVVKPSLVCAITGSESLIWGNSRKYELFIVDSNGKTIMKISRACRAQKLSQAQKNQLRERFSRTSSARFGARPAFPKTLPFYRDISVDEDGRIYVQTYEASKGHPGYYHDVFDAEGRFITKFVMQGGGRGPLWKDHKLYVIETDDEGFDTLVRYNVVWQDKGSDR